MPADPIRTVIPLEVELRVVKDDVAPNQVGGDIGNDPRCERPIVVVPLVGRVQAAEPRLLQAL